MKRIGLWVAALLTVAISAPAAADWLVTVDGARLETRGAWEVRGAQVVFTDIRGKLRSLPLDEVDLEASREAAAGSAEEGETHSSRRRPSLAEVAEATKRQREAGPEAVAVLTDDDVMRLPPEVAAARSALEATANPTENGEPGQPNARRRIRLPPVTLYSTSWCPWCRRARGLLIGLGVPFTEKDIEGSALAEMEMRRKAGRGAGVPVLDIGGTILRGYDQDRIIRTIVQKATELSRDS